eukprot:11984167-Alexandrium_andersonii.AAC.1
MSASLVGSEMCIRDRPQKQHRNRRLAFSTGALRGALRIDCERASESEARGHPNLRSPAIVRARAREIANSRN